MAKGHILSPQGALGGLHGLNSINLGNQGGGPSNKTPKEAYKRMAGNTHADRGLSHDERLNLSVDVAGRHQLPGGGHSTRNNSVGYKKHSQARDYNLRMSRINEEKLNNSVHEFNSGKK